MLLGPRRVLVILQELNEKWKGSGWEMNGNWMGVGWNWVRIGCDLNENRARIGKE